MTTKQTERLHQECIKLGIDFPEHFFSREEEVKVIIRWSKSSDKPSNELVVSKLKSIGCLEIPKVKPIQFDF